MVKLDPASVILHNFLAVVLPLQMLLSNVMIICFFPLGIHTRRVFTGFLCMRVPELLCNKEHVAISVYKASKTWSCANKYHGIPPLAIALH